MATTKKAPAKKAPAKKTTAKKAPVPASENRPNYQVVDDVFVFLDKEQGEVRIPLRFKMKLLRQINQLEDQDDIDQLFALLDGLGDTRSIEQIDEMDVFDAMELVEAYFGEFEKKNEARLGESSRSSK